MAKLTNDLSRYQYSGFAAYWGSLFIVIEILDEGVEGITSLLVEPTRLGIVGGVVVKHAQESLAVGLVKADDGHGESYRLF